MHLLVSTAPGLGKTLENELITLGYSPHHTFNSGTYIDADMKAMMHINLWSRTANKIYQQVGFEKNCTDFDTLFDTIKLIKRNNYVPLNSPVVVHAQTHNSQLHATKVIQSVGHKAVIVGLTGSPTRTRETNDHKTPIEIRLTLYRNNLNIRVNTSGDALFQRGYKTGIGQAPLKENIAAALILINQRNKKDILLDPCCGSGSIPIEAALIATNKAPGRNRRFAFERFPSCDRGMRNTLTKTAKKQEKRHTDSIIIGRDIDESVLKKAKDNADNAGVGSIVQRQKQNILTTSSLNKDSIQGAHIVTNPPYGKRLDESKVKNIHHKLSDVSKQNSTTIITNYRIQPSTGRHIIKTKNGPEPCTIYTKNV